jgi:hypothetical protein
VTRQDDTIIGVRQVLLLAAHILAVSSPSPALHVFRILSSWTWLAQQTLHVRTAFQQQHGLSNPHIRASRGGPDKAIRRCKAGGLPETTIAVVRIACEIATSRSTHEGEKSI